MEIVKRISISTNQGKKTLSIRCGDILTLDTAMDVMTVSAFYRSYGARRGL